MLGYRVRPHSADDLERLRKKGIDRPEDDPYIALDPIDEPGPGFWFLEVPEGKTVKNRVHLDVFFDVDTLIASGATVVQRHPHWTVMADPEGNEFCAFAPGEKPG